MASRSPSPRRSRSSSPRASKLGAVGSTVTLGNGSVAKVVEARYKDNANNKRLGRVGQAYKRLKIVKGGRPPSASQRKRRSITRLGAQRAFTKYWKDRYNKASSESSKRGVKSAWARDLLYRSPVRETKAYLRKSGPGKFDYPGVDLGEKTYAPASGARAAALARGRDKRRSQLSARRRM